MTLIAKVSLGYESRLVYEIHELSSRFLNPQRTPTECTKSARMTSADIFSGVNDEQGGDKDSWDNELRSNVQKKDNA